MATYDDLPQGYGPTGVNPVFDDDFAAPAPVPYFEGEELSAPIGATIAQPPVQPSYQEVSSLDDTAPQPAVNVPEVSFQQDPASGQQPSESPYDFAGDIDPFEPRTQSQDADDSSYEDMPDEELKAAGAAGVVGGFLSQVRGRNGSLIITLCTVVVVAAICLIIGFATKGILTYGSDASHSDIVQSSDASVTDLSAGATNATVLAAMQSNLLSWNGNPLVYNDPSVNVANNVVVATATYVDPDTSIKQAVALAESVFSDKAVTSFTFNSYASDGTVMAVIRFNPATISVESLKALESGTCESAYSASASYSLADQAYKSSGYSIAASGGTESNTVGA